MLIEDLMKQVNEGSIQQIRPYSGDAVFLNRIHALEDMYGLKWYEFMQKIDEHKLVPANQQELLDYAEWRILCQKFSERLEDGLEGLTIMAFASPPTSDLEYETNQGPSNRAFLLCYTCKAYGSSAHH